MLIITHALVGATLATKIKSLFLSLPLVTGVHFLMDFIPHWDLGTEIEKRSRLKNFSLALFDGVISLLAVFFLFQRHMPLTLLPWLGAGFGILPDLIEAPHIFLDFHLFPSIDRFHSQTSHQESKNILWGLLPQAAIILLIFLTL
jgi:hypothetical protein